MDILDISDTAIPEIKVIVPRAFGDRRGHFLETFNARKYQQFLPVRHEFVQDNVSLSRKGVLRGLHLQNPYGQGKLVMVLEGAVLDVVVDVRRGSPTFGRHVAVELDSRSFLQLWIPPGFAHGFLGLSDEALFLYKCDAPYSRDSEIGIRWNDPALGIHWNVESPLLSEKDAAAPFLHQVEAQLPLYQG
jgi:dTDP-4-dehydrorhamnose 3,5-epimerase